MRSTFAPIAGLGAALLAGTASATYTETVRYDSTNFFDTWDFWTDADPTAGTVDYVDRDTANNAGLIGTGNNAIYMGVDTTTVNPANGRQSVRLTSQQSFTHGLFIADIAHMPGSICGIWPAFWMFGPNWPASGEIDILEGVNTQTTNQVTLHTNPDFVVTNDGTIDTTTLVTNDCGADSGYTGCSQVTGNTLNYGDGFNANGGGVYATEWASDHISIWFFANGTVPADVTNGTPDTSGWGPPGAKFNNADVDGWFSNNNLVFDTTFCGSWAGEATVWDANAECSALSATCEDYVLNNPGAYAEGYWSVNSVTVYQDN